MSLVTHARYSAITGDYDSSAPSVAEALADAQALLEDELGRGLEATERTERLRIHADGRVYPSATPVTAASGYTLVGVAALDGASPAGGPFDLSSPSYATVTYTGGYTADDVPRCIERDIAWAAHRQLRPAVLAAVPAGATSVRMGDAAVTFDSPQRPGDAEGSWSRATLRYRRRRV